MIVGLPKNASTGMRIASFLWVALWLLPLLILPNRKSQLKKIEIPKVEKSEFIQFAMDHSNYFIKRSEKKPLVYFRAGSSHQIPILQQEFQTKINSRLYSLRVSHFRDGRKTLHGEYDFDKNEEEFLLQIL